MLYCYHKETSEAARKDIVHSWRRGRKRGKKSAEEAIPLYLENSTQKNSHGPLLIAVALLLAAAIAGVNYYGQRGGTAAQSSTASGTLTLPSPLRSQPFWGCASDISLNEK